jgi:hypothetical protein
MIHRSFDAEYLERVHAYHERPGYQKAMRKRSVWVTAPALTGRRPFLTLAPLEAFRSEQRTDGGGIRA